MNTTITTGEHHLKHLKHKDAVMATGRKNSKSLQMSVRLPLEDLEAIEQVKAEGESIAGFLITAAKSEIKRRQRKLVKSDTKD
ncbi:YlcI/YnfO family protein [Aeromonas salmonicida]|uniref:YlcI/YnfO family protein n=1 Tax=Aeromonas salmonicida TaxID=645 RepID=UPI0039A492B0